MKKIITVDFFADSKKWTRRMPRIKKISSKTIKAMTNYFDNVNFINLNLILSNKKRVKS